MAKQNLEDILKQMTKPEVPEMKHEKMLAKLIVKTKGRSAVSFWWLCIPLYMLAAFVMKSLYVWDATFISTLHELINTKGYTAVLMFLVLPVVLIIANLVSIKQLFYLYSSLTKKGFIKMITGELIIIILSLLVLIIYFV